MKKFVGRLRQDDVDQFRGRLYEITYSTRPGMNFDNPVSDASLDAYYAANAKTTIDTWVTKKIGSGCINTVNKIADALFYRDSSKKISFIWYSVPQDKKDIDSIALFNRLNKGKIKLTGSELVKALFILSIKDQNNEDQIVRGNAVARFSLEWDEIVRKLQNDSFWYFISDKSDVQTRMDTLLTFVTGVNNDDDAYREFQKAYDVFVLNRRRDDYEFKAFDGKKYKCFPDMWDILKRGFDDLVRWYEDITAYNYIGWLVRNGRTLNTIKSVWAGQVDNSLWLIVGVDTYHLYYNKHLKTGHCYDDYYQVNLP